MKFHFYTSDAASRYREGALESLVYPRGHVITFRYRELHVAQRIRNYAVAENGAVKLPWFRRSAIIIYAETRSIESTTRLSVDDINNFEEIKNRLLNPSDPFSAIFINKLSESEKTIFKEQSLVPCSAGIKEFIINTFNKVIDGPCIHEPALFKDVLLRPETELLLGKHPVGPGLAHLNRLLLEDIFPLELQKRQAFLFFPLRHARLLKIWKRGNVFYASLKLQDYVVYEPGHQTTIQNAIEKSGTNPPTKNIDSSGYGGDFLGISKKTLIPVVPQKNQIAEDNAWQTTTNELSQSAILNRTVFHRVRGFYRQGGFWSRNQEKLVTPKTTNNESFYRLSMARNYILKVLTFAPHVNQIDRAKQPVYEVVSQTDDGYVITPKEIRVSSSYNEDCILIACKRVLVSTLAPIDFKKKMDAGEGEKPEVSFLTHVEVPRYILLLFILLGGAGTALLSVGPDFITAFCDLMTWNIKPLDAAQFAVVSKGAGAFLIILAGYVTFRKLPAGK